MTRESFLDLLTRSVSEGWLTKEEAAALLRSFDAGELETDAYLLWQSEPVVVDQAEAAVAFAALLALVNTPRIRAGQPALAERLQAGFQQAVTQHAADYAATGNVRTWHTAMRGEVRRYLIQQAEAGLGRALTVSEVRALEPVIEAQLRYLNRFAEEASVKALAGQPLSQSYVASRSQMYAGEGLRQFYQTSEGAAGAGYVVDYVARDDSGTCSPCHAAEMAGPYLPGEGPMPGAVCLGRGRCRCRREMRYAPAEAERLRGRAA